MLAGLEVRGLLDVLIGDDDVTMADPKTATSPWSSKLRLPAHDRGRKHGLRAEARQGEQERNSRQRVRGEAARLLDLTDYPPPT
ncbi:MAG: hypothetical protein U1U88_001510 [Lawsonella clevelandensis]